MNAYIKKNNGERLCAAVSEEKRTDCTILSLPRACITEDTDFVDFCPEYLTSGVDEVGYMVIPRGTKQGGTMLCRFHERADTEYISDSNLMPIWGFRTGEKSMIARVTGMIWDYQIVAGVKNNRYYAYPRFTLDPETTYEDVQVTYYTLPAGSTYSDMARFYRTMRLAEGCIPLKDRVKTSKELAYAAEAIEIRIRMAWKPVPAPVEEQTKETEPAVVTACTAQRVKELTDEMASQGVARAEICLVGFETKGHDGRWPQTFPIEQTIGGQEALEDAIAHGKSRGYQMVAHTNSTEMYRISEDWDPEKIIRKRDDSFLMDPIAWGGGRPYMMCPIFGLEFSKRNLPRVAALGFRGIHYIDVLSIFPPRKCYHKDHPLNRKETVGYIRKIMELSHNYFGGFASEGGFDFAADLLDYVLYTSYNILGVQPDICDEVIPFWQLVYHGIILYNPGTETVNYCVKQEVNHLKNIEYGGRPLAYFYSKYVDEGGCGNWMGDEDLLCETEEQLHNAVGRIKQMQREYEKLSYLQYEFMDRHEEVAPGVFEIAYSDGTLVIVNYNNNTYNVQEWS